jgi:hypothetical protein
MVQETVRKLEQELEEAIAGVIVQMGLKNLPLLPSRQTMHLMAKAAENSRYFADSSPASRPVRI